MAVEFSAEDRRLVEHLIEHYPQKKAALGDVLYLAQSRFGHLSPEVEVLVAEALELSPTYVHQVVTFYNLYLEQPVGRHLIALCDNVSCTLCGALPLVEHLRRRLGIDPGQTTADGRFTLWTVECLGACELAPVMMVGGRLHGNLTPELLDRILDSLE